jgi:hypothetical protein
MRVGVAGQLPYARLILPRPREISSVELAQMAREITRRRKTAAKR